VPPNKGE
jgi:site-specific recombinase XerD